MKIKNYIEKQFPHSYTFKVENHNIVVGNFCPSLMDSLADSVGVIYTNSNNNKDGKYHAGNMVGSRPIDVACQLFDLLECGLGEYNWLTILKDSKDCQGYNNFGFGEALGILKIGGTVKRR